MAAGGTERAWSALGAPAPLLRLPSTAAFVTGVGLAGRAALCRAAGGRKLPAGPAEPAAVALGDRGERHVEAEARRERWRGERAAEVDALRCPKVRPQRCFGGAALAGMGWASSSGTPPPWPPRPRGRGAGVPKDTATGACPVPRATPAFPATAFAQTLTLVHALAQWYGGRRGVQRDRDDAARGGLHRPGQDRAVREGLGQGARRAAPPRPHWRVQPGALRRRGARPSPRICSADFVRNGVGCSASSGAASSLWTQRARE